jgi:hypothetical protein
MTLGAFITGGMRLYGLKPYRATASPMISPTVTLVVPRTLLFSLLINGKYPML